LGGNFTFDGRGGGLSAGAGSGILGGRPTAP
jgi:hypothetical protein